MDEAPFAVYGLREVEHERGAQGAEPFRSVPEVEREGHLFRCVSEGLEGALHRPNLDKDVFFILRRVSVNTSKQERYGSLAHGRWLVCAARGRTASGAFSPQPQGSGESG